MAITPEYARQSIRQLVSVTLHEQGFTHVQESSLQQLEHQTLDYLGHLLSLAKEHAADARRGRPQARDVVAACEYFGVTIDALRETSERQTGRAVAEPSIDVEPALEEVEQLPSTFLPDRTQPSRLSGQPKHLPKLPQEHIYKQTPVFQTLSSHAHDTAKVQLEHRVDTSLLVEHSLRNLVKALDAAAAPPAKKPGLVFKFAGSDVPVVNYEIFNAAEVATGANKKRFASALTGPQPAKRIAIRFSA